ncbi:LOW QUALITY PROTEIN: protein canopy homolog 2-like, partial [Plakobranchus ocellatus]
MAPPFPLSNRATDIRPGCKTQRIVLTLQQVADLVCTRTKERKYFKTCIVGHVNCCLQCGPTLRLQKINKFNMTFKLPVLVLCTSMVLVLVSGAGKSNQKYDFCSACRALVLEADEQIKDVDPKRTIETGSFRVDPNGNQKIKDKLYARSNTHLEELVESICGKMHQYANRVYDDGTTQLVRIKGYSDEYNDDLKLDYDKGKILKYHCEHFLEDYEEDVISYLQQEDIQDHEEFICHEKLGVCSAQQLQVKLETFQRPKERHNVEVDGDEDEDDDDDEEENPDDG